jgi:methyl halide transferase
MEKEFWENRWENGQTGWDIGAVSTPIKEYIDQITDHELNVLVPGCGNAYEAEYLWEQGFKNVKILEIAKGAIDSFKKRFPDFPADQIFFEDFFKLDSKEHQFDLIIEQTFFCAIHPSMRPKYAEKMSELIRPGGKLVGLLFDFPLESGPPFGGNKEEYLGYFKPYFHIRLLEKARNSIKPRSGREFFMILERK